MNIKELNQILINHCKKIKEDSLTLYQLERVLDKNNIYHQAIKNFSAGDLDCYLVILVDEVWYYATGAIFFDD